MRNVVALSVLMILAAVAGTNQAIAAGAIAIGIAPGGVAKGYASGFYVGAPNVETARTRALEQCRKPTSNVSGSAADSGTRAAQAHCDVVTTFTNQCYAQALDPKDGTPGAGWAVADTVEQAEKEALARCRSTAGADRRDFCKVYNHNCDGRR